MDRIVSKEEFIENIKTNAEQLCKEYPWRMGQAVFNYVDDRFGVARKVQFVDKVDCYYNDDAIDDFIEMSWDRYIAIIDEYKFSEPYE